MKKIYKVIDSSGRIGIPISLREELNIELGDVLELYVNKQMLIIEKVDIVRLNDSSEESMRNMVISTAKKMDKKNLLKLTKYLVELVQKEEKDDSGVKKQQENDHHMYDSVSMYDHCYDSACVCRRKCIGCYPKRMEKC